MKYKGNNSFIYSAIQAQKRSDARIFLKLKGEKFKLFSEYAVDNLKIKMSLEDLFWNFQKSNPNENCPTLKTLYSWYHTNFISYPNDVKVVKKYRNKVKGKVRDGRRSIHERPFELDDYSISSHYEIDTIYNSDKKGGLLTFTNRNTMMIYSSPISDRKASTINSSLRKIIEHIGIDNIDSITSDNGTEFSYTKVLECSYNLTWYYADPYCSGQRGQNERLNRDIRKYYNKGVDFKTVPIEEFNKVIDLINNKPRRKYGGLSAIKKSIKLTNITFEERKDIEILYKAGYNYSQISIRIGRSRNSIMKEIKRNSKPRQPTLQNKNIKLTYTAKYALAKTPCRQTVYNWLKADIIAYKKSFYGLFLY